MQINEAYSKLRILVAGCGSIGKRRIQVLTELGITHIVACEPNENQRKEVKKLFPMIETVEDYDSVINSCHFDAVFIFTPTGLHLSMAVKAIKAGCHVFIEKPLANSSEGVEELKKLAKDQGVRPVSHGGQPTSEDFMVGMWRIRSLESC